jgi:Na+/H+ antiporter NhaB
MMFPGAPMESGPKVVEPEGIALDLHKEDIEEFRNFLRSVLMHGAVGTDSGEYICHGNPRSRPSFGAH